MKKTKKIMIISLIILAFSMMVVGCAAPPTQEGSKSGQSENKDKTKVALLLVNSINDAGWGESSYKGFTKAKEKFGFEGAYTESLQLPDMESAIRDYATKGYNVIVMSSADFSESAKNVAPDYPNIKFVLINGQVAQAPNLANFRPNTPEAGFIAGAFAGLITKSNTVGMIGGKKLPPVEDAMNGFIAGAKYVNSNVNVLQSYIDSWTDISKGSEAALAMIENKADVVSSNTGQAALGTINAAKGKGIFAVGYIDDQNKVAPGTVPFSALQDVGSIVYSGIESALSKEFKPEVVLVGAKDGVISLSDFYTLGDKPVSDDIKNKMKEIYKGIVDGSLKNKGVLPKSGFEK